MLDRAPARARRRPQPVRQFRRGRLPEGGADAETLVRGADRPLDAESAAFVPATVSES